MTHMAQGVGQVYMQHGISPVPDVTTYLEKIQLVIGTQGTTALTVAPAFAHSGAL